MDREPDPPKRMATQGNRVTMLNTNRKNILHYIVRKTIILI